MTPALQDHPHTALDLLFGPGNDTPEALASQVLSADANRDLGQALESLPSATREAAAREVTAAAAGLLNIDLIGGLLAGWRKHHDLTAAALRTLAAPGSAELVDMAGHQITATQHPSVTVLLDGAQVATIQLGLSLVFRVTAMGARITLVRLVALLLAGLISPPSWPSRGPLSLPGRHTSRCLVSSRSARESGCWPPITTRPARGRRKGRVTATPSKWHLSATALVNRLQALPPSAALAPRRRSTLASGHINGMSAAPGRRQAHLMLPGVIPLSPGIRLLAAGSYPVSARSPRRCHAGPMSSIDPSAAAPPRDDGGVRSRSMAWAGVICRVSTRCAIAPLTPAAEKDVPSHVAYPPAL